MQQILPIQPELLSNAFRLVERIHGNPTATAAADSPAAQRAQRILKRWRDQSPFPQQPGAFERRLAMDGLTEQELLNLLTETPESLLRRVAAAGDWLHQMLETFAAASPDSPESGDWHDLPGFLTPFLPLVERSAGAVKRGIQSLAAAGELPFGLDQTLRAVFAILPRQLMRVASRTMVLELNVARVEGLLAGETSEERFASFLDRLADPQHAAGLIEEYPVMIRLIQQTLDQWVETSLELIARLAADWSEIVATLGGGFPSGNLVEIHSEMGDRHQGGRSVSILEFESGLRVVYKPKSMAIDVHFQELLEWMNARGLDLPLRTLQVINRDTHGWVEFVEHKGCDWQEQVERYYWRQGAFLAVLYALEAVDFHYENMRASGEHPLPLDLEALFHPRLNGIDADQKSFERMNYSVLRVGLLPSASIDEELQADFSGMGSTDGQMSPFEAPICEGQGTDEMRFTRKRVELEPGQNQPTLAGRMVDPLRYLEPVLAGFEQAYRLLMTHREELLAPNGPIERFAGDTVRVILRGTRIYGLLLDESFHPDFQRNALDRDRAFDRLWLATKDLPYLRNAIRHERTDLWNGDIPMFTTQPNAVEMTASNGEQIRGCFEVSALDAVRSRIAALSESDLASQVWFIRASLGTLATGVVRQTGLRDGLMPRDPAVVQQELLAEACRVGDRLAELAHVNDRGAAWIGLSYISERQSKLQPLMQDLYDGLPGVAMFLGHLGAVTQNSKYTELARQAIRMTSFLMNQPEAVRVSGMGGFSGAGGWIYTLTHLSALWNDATLLDEATRIAGRVASELARDKAFDVIGGAAGCIPALIGLHQLSGAPSALAAARACGDHLILNAQRRDRGIAWKTQGSDDRLLAGFAHGTAGIALALSDLFAATGREVYLKAALGAVEYERGLFDVEEGNWPDLRRFDGPAEIGAVLKYQVAWCHGAAGIGLARLRMLANVPADFHPALRADLDAALRTTLAEGFGHGHSLCHGDLGNVDLLIEASQSHDVWYRARLFRQAGRILDSIRENGWMCGNPSRLESPGLMTGIAGIGYGLLRLAAPDQTPSILSLAIPQAQNVIAGDAASAQSMEVIR